MKFKKSPPPHVWCHKNGFTRRTDTPFDSAGTHGPKQHFQSKFWILKSFENFFRALQVKPPRLLKGIFWCFRSHFCKNSWKSCKNRHLRTSGWIKMDSRSFRWHHALCWKALDSGYPAKTYLMVIRCIERIIFTILWKMWFPKISQNCYFCLEIH